MTDYVNYDRDIEVRKKLEMNRCEYDLAGNRYAYISPKDNLLISDADGFLIDSLQRFDQAMRDAGHPELTYEELSKLSADKNDIEKELDIYMNEFASAYIGKPKKFEAVLKSQKRYRDLSRDYKEAKAKLEAFYDAKDYVLEEVDPNGEHLNYDWIYDPNECEVDEEACKLIIDNVGEGRVYSKGVIASWENCHKEVEAKVKLLRPYLENIPILSIPYHLQPYKEGAVRSASDKVYVLSDIHGKFNTYLSSFHDDSGSACRRTSDLYPKLIVCHKSSSITSCESLRDGIEKVKTRKTV